MISANTVSIFNAASFPSTSVDLVVRPVDPRADPRWESFVCSHPNGSVYHHPAWLEALEGEYDRQGRYYACEDRSGRFRGILPLLDTRGLPLGIVRSLAGRRWSSLPRTPVAGPLCLDLSATRALLRVAVDLVKSNTGFQLQLKTQGRELDGLVDGLDCTPWRFSYVLRLPTADQPLQMGNSRNRSRIKWAINKARKLGVYVRAAETKDDLHTWYKLYLETMRQSAVLARSYRFFVSLWDLLRPRGMMQLLLAEQCIDGHTRMIAGSIFFNFGNVCSYAFNGSRARDLTLRPNDLIQWHAIHEARAKGLQIVDLGEVPDGHIELAKFKSKWGAEPVRLHRYYYPPRAANELVEAESALEAVARGIWRRMPLPLISWLGDRVYSYL